MEKDKKLEIHQTMECLNREGYVVVRDESLGPKLKKYYWLAINYDYQSIFIGGKYEGSRKIGDFLIYDEGKYLAKNEQGKRKEIKRKAEYMESEGFTVFYRDLEMEDRCDLGRMTYLVKREEDQTDEDIPESPFGQQIKIEEIDVYSLLK